MRKSSNGTEMKRKRRKKGKLGLKGFFVLLILVGIGIGLLSLFRQDLSRLARPWLERRGLLEEKRAVTLYFSDREAEYLVGEKGEIKKREDVEDEARELVHQLIRVPRGRFFQPCLLRRDCCPSNSMRKGPQGSTLTSHSPWTTREEVRQR
jgi:hypothetical protein